jgi:hypothetical protein
MFTSRFVYKEKSQRKPVVKEFKSKTEALQNIATEISRIISLLSEPTDENNEAGFFMDNVAISTSEMFKSLIVGSGPNISVRDNDEATETIRAWNEQINVNGDTIEDFMGSFIIDCLIYNRSYWRIARNVKGIDNEITQAIDLQRMDPKSIEVEYDDERGIRKYLQIVEPHSRWKTINQFLKSEFQTYDYQPYDTIVIPDDQRVILAGKLFTKAPMDSALPYIILKYWLLTFMRKFADKAWAGILIAYIGDPKTSFYADNPIIMQDAINKTTASLDQLRSFGAATFPGDTRIEKLDPPQQGKIYSEWFDKMNREIAYCFYSSIGIRESNSTFKGNEQINENLINFAKGVRRIMENLVSRFYIMNIVPGIKKRDIIFNWPELRTTSIEAYARAFSLSVSYGVFKDARERRRALSPIWNYLSDKITDEESKKLDESFEKLNSPSQPEDGKGNENSVKGNSQSRKSGAKHS